MNIYPIEAAGKAQRDLEKHERRAAEARAIRDDAIRAAVADGTSHVALAKQTGLTRQAIQKIAAHPTGGENS